MNKAGIHSPDLSTSDFYLFPKLKQIFAGKRFTSKEYAAVKDYFEELQETSFNQGIELLEKSWTKCIQVSGDYIEN